MPRFSTRVWGTLVRGKERAKNKVTRFHCTVWFGFDVDTTVLGYTAFALSCFQEGSECAVFPLS
jgi:hypothetical protein